MKVALLTLLALLPGWGLLTQVRTRNEAVQQGQAAYRAGQAMEAAYLLRRAVAARPGKVDPALWLNLGHAQLRAGQTVAARATYGRLLTGSPPAIGSVARQQLAVLAVRDGQSAQALRLLRQALVLNPANRVARYNYEVLSDYLARQPDPLPTPPPSTGRQSAKKQEEQPDSIRQKPAAETRPNNQAGARQPGEANQPRPGDQPIAPQPGAGTGRPAGTRPPGSGAAQPMPSGTAPGAQRGLDRNGAGTEAPLGHNGRRPGTEAAAPEDLRLQTQRERLRAMNLTPAQARQLLEALGAQEQQYLQQLTRPAPARPDPGKPTW